MFSEVKTSGGGRTPISAERTPINAGRTPMSPSCVNPHRRSSAGSSATTLAKELRRSGTPCEHGIVEKGKRQTMRREKLCEEKNYALVLVARLFVPFR